jgi:SSS family solute:Na+ symporter
MGIIMIVLMVMGGLEGTAWMNFVHSFVMFLAVGLAAYFGLKYVGGYSTLKANLPSSYFSLLQPSVWSAAAYCFSACNILGSATTLACISGAKSVGVAKRGLIIGSLLVIVYSVFPSLVGMAGKVSGLDLKPANVLYQMTDIAGGEIGSALLSMGIMAAILSTATMLLFSATVTATRDFYKGMFKPDCTQTQELFFGKVFTVVIGFIGIFLGLQFRSIIASMLGALQIRSIAGILLFVGICWKRVTPRAGFWSLLIGGILATVWFFLDNPFGIEPLYPSAIVGLLIMIIVTVSNPEKGYVNPGYREYQKLKREAVEEGIL